MQGETGTNSRRRSNRFNLRNLPQSYTQEDVAALLNPCGKYAKFDLHTGTDGNVTVSVEYETPEEATEAASKLTKEQIDGKALKIDFVGIRSGGRTRQDNANRNQNANASSQQNANRSASNNDFPLRILVPTEVVGAIIGRKGETIKQITQTSHARIDIHGRENIGQTPEKAITIYGTPENCTAACKEILKIIEQEQKNENSNAELVLKILAYNQLCGRLIGKGGVVIKQIMTETNTKITVSRQEWFAPGNVTASDRVITVKGDLDNMAQAESKISERLRACYENDSQAQQPLASNTALNMFPPPFNLAHTSGGPSGSLQTSFPPNYAAPGNMQRFPQFQMTQPMQQPPNWYSQPPGPWTGGSNFQPQPAVSSNTMQPQNTSMVMGSAPPPPAVNQISGSTGGLNANSNAPQNGTAAQWPPSEVVNLYIPNLAVGAIIGQKGSYIRKIIQLSKASIKVAPLSKQAEETAGAGDANGNRERVVTISGTPEAQWNAQFYIFDKIKTEGFCGNDDPRLMTEITVPKSKVGRIIGKGGRKVREIQQLSAAVVKLPEQPSDQGDDVKIQIVGNFYANQTAQRFVRALCSANQLPNSNMPLTGAPTTTVGGPQTAPTSYPSGPAPGRGGQAPVQQNRMMMQHSGGQQPGVVSHLHQQQGQQQVTLNGAPAMPMPPSFGSMVPPSLSHPYQSGTQPPYGHPPYGHQQHPGSYQQHHGHAPPSSSYHSGGGHQSSSQQYHHGGSSGAKHQSGQSRGGRSNNQGSKAGIVVPPPGTVLSNNSSTSNNGANNSNSGGATTNGAATTTTTTNGNGSSTNLSANATAQAATTITVVNGTASAAGEISNDSEPAIDATTAAAAAENGGECDGSPADAEAEPAAASEMVPAAPAPITVDGSN